MQQLQTLAINILQDKASSIVVGLIYG